MLVIYYVACECKMGHQDSSGVGDPPLVCVVVFSDLNPVWGHMESKVVWDKNHQWWGRKHVSAQRKSWEKRTKDRGAIGIWSDWLGPPTRNSFFQLWHIGLHFQEFFLISNFNVLGFIFVKLFLRPFCQR